MVPALFYSCYYITVLVLLVLFLEFGMFGEIQSFRQLVISTESVVDKSN